MSDSRVTQDPALGTVLGMPAPEVSVCILAGHDVEHLDACLASLAAQVSPPSFEVLIGGSRHSDVRSAVLRHFPQAQLCDTPARPPGAARNPLIERARGELLLFLDDDVTAPPQLLRRLADIAAGHPTASVFGGPNDTPPGSSRFQALQGTALGSLVGSGPVSKRYTARHPAYADERWFTLCNLAVRRRVMLPFASQLTGGEENELLSRLRARGEPMRYDPTLRAFHTRRPTWGSFARQMFKYGYGRGQLLAWSPQTVRLAYLLPVGLVVYLVALGPLLAIGNGAVPFLLAPLAIYVGLASATGLRAAWTTRQPSSALGVGALIPTIHVCYALGLLGGLLSMWPRRQPVSGERSCDRGTQASESLETDPVKAVPSLRRLLRKTARPS